MFHGVPFEWQLRLSKRAKRPRLTISRYGEVQLVWPHRMSQQHIASMLQEHTAWVLKHLQKTDNNKTNIVPPQTIMFAAVQRMWSVKYIQAEAGFKVVEGEQSLTVSGYIEDKEALRKALNIWIKKKGHMYLKPWLADMAQEMQVSYAAVSIRLQKHRWGSCSSKGRINLNAALLFLPDFLVRHVLIHELTHLKHLNHSLDFWSNVETFDVNYKNHRKLLKQYTADVPVWLTKPFS